MHGTVLVVIITAVVFDFTNGFHDTKIYLAYRITARADRGTVGSGFKVGQVVSASMVSLAHSTNDARRPSLPRRSASWPVPWWSVTAST